MNAVRTHTLIDHSSVTKPEANGHELVSSQYRRVRGGDVRIFFFPQVQLDLSMY